MRKIYPLPSKVEIRSTTTLGEVRQPQAPSVLMEIGFHDNYADATWVAGHIQDIAAQLVAGLCDYFSLPFISPWGERQGRVDIASGTLNLRNYPADTGAIIANMPKNSPVTVYGAQNGWYSVGFSAYLGYAAAAHIDV
ncbi:SH3 domain-containing protein [Bengtsoniella intestinalis]|uniref:SH3 domain-containing protein n=1 Tax=Bengtsoniella intestinalis TaxID=3073143 RepID=UPI00391FC61E